LPWAQRSAHISSTDIPILVGDAFSATERLLLTITKCLCLSSAVCRLMFVYLDVPSRPGRPHVTKVSEREVFLLWEEPETDGNSYIHAYKVDWFRPGLCLSLAAWLSGNAVVTLISK